MASRHGRSLREACAGLLSSLLISTFVAGCGSEEPERLSALLITLDTTIPEILHCYGGPPDASPHLDALAAESILFENARTVAPLTLPAHASMLTGQYPVRHSVRMNGSMILPSAADTLAERARERGYQTGAFIAAVVLNEAFGLAQGFDVYDDPDAPKSMIPHAAPARLASDVADHAIRWLEDFDSDEPFFGWVHMFDPHAPYEPPAEYLRPHGNPYRGEVTFMDAHVGRVLDALKRLGRWDETLIVVVGDHGEGLSRHGEGTHACFVFDTTLDVPLIVRHPDGRRAGERVKEIVSVVDVHPTIVRALGLGTTGNVDGYDLLSPELDPKRGVYFESYFGFVSFGWSQVCGWADAEGKYVHSSTPEFFDLVADPGEENNVIEQRGDVIARYREGIRRIADRERLAQEGFAAGENESLAAEIEKLGYGGAGVVDMGMPDPLSRPNRVSPHTRVKAQADFEEAQKLCDRRQFAQALPTLQRLYGENPFNHNASFLLGSAYIALGRPADAIAPLLDTIENRGEKLITGPLFLALAYEDSGQTDMAIDTYERALREVVGPPGFMERLVKLLKATGQHEKAKQYEKRLAEAGR